MAKQKTRKRVVFFVILMTLWAYYAVYAARWRYEEKTEAEFLAVLGPAIENYTGPFWFSDIFNFDWDKIVIIESDGSSSPAWPIEDFISEEGLRSTHWTQVMPRDLLDASFEFIIGPSDDYGLAVIFIKDRRVIKVIKTSGMVSGQILHDHAKFYARDIKVEKKNNHGSEYFSLSDK